jgi:UDP-glucose 4-epimerase
VLHLNILLTGGTGYIGSHTAVLLAQAGHQLVLYDNLSNSNVNVLDSLQQILGLRLTFVQGDIRDTALLMQTFEQCNIDAVLHFAGLKAVGESVAKPIDYFDNNVGGTISLIKAMQAKQINTLVFSSSATVYGDPQYLPIDEQHPTQATSPYGRTKLHIEQMLADVAAADDAWRIICLRYFNPVGAHASGLIGENPHGIPNNLMPYIAKVGAGSLPQLNVFGEDYATPDGTGVRDYIHVMDLAEGHVAALNYAKNRQPGLHTFNLGTGCGYSVLQMIEAYQAAAKKSIPYVLAPRRAGDVAACYADARLAREQLNWHIKHSLADMCASTFYFQTLQQSSNADCVNN